MSSADVTCENDTFEVALRDFSHAAVDLTIQITLQRFPQDRAEPILQDVRAQPEDEVIEI